MAMISWFRGHVANSYVSKMGLLTMDQVDSDNDYCM